MSNNWAELNSRFRDLRSGLESNSVQHSLPETLPPNPSLETVDSIGSELLRLYAAHKNVDAYCLLFDFSATEIGKLASNRVKEAAPDVDATELLAQVFRKVFHVAEDQLEGRTFLQIVKMILDHLAPPVVNPAHQMLGLTGANRMRLMEAMEHALEVMPENTQLCFYLATVEKRSIPDIAHMLGMSLAEVTRAMSDARQVTLRILAELDEPESEEGAS